MNLQADAVGSLTPGEIEQLFFTIESSLQIHRRYQFYVWAQSRLYALIPHDVLICAHHDPSRKSMQFDCFSMFPLPKPALDGAYQPVSGMKHSRPIVMCVASCPGVSCRCTVSPSIGPPLAVPDCMRARCIMGGSEWTHSTSRR